MSNLGAKRCKMSLIEKHHSFLYLLPWGRGGQVTVNLAPHSILLVTFFGVGCKMSNLGAKLCKMSSIEMHHSFLNLLPWGGQVNVNLAPHTILLVSLIACIFFWCRVQNVKLGCKTVQNELYRKASLIFKFASMGGPS